MVLVRDISIQQINAALLALEKEIERLQKLVETQASEIDDLKSRLPEQTS